MFKNRLEKKRKIQELKRNCFFARKDLICVGDERVNIEPACIRMMCGVESQFYEPWIANVDPEGAYKAIGLSVRYCAEFDAIRPLRYVCKSSTCPMYAKYIKYIQACSALDSKTK